MRKVGETIRALLVGLVLGLLGGCGGSPPKPLVVFNAAALGPPFRALGDSLKAPPHSFLFQQENAPSVEAIRKLTELGRVPDILATADVSLFDALVVPKYSSWYVVFGTNALVLAYGPKSQGREAISPEKWWEVLLRHGVRTGRSDPSIDPSGYRTLMALQLAERYYAQPGLAARLLAAMPIQFVRRAEAELSALLEAGEVDYIWTYRNLALAHRLEFLELPHEINMADPALAEWYSQAKAKVSGRTPGDSLNLVGAPILFALTIPNAAPHPEAARAFLELVLSPIGAAVLKSTGFEPLPTPAVVGAPPPQWQSILRPR